MNQALFLSLELISYISDKKGVLILLQREIAIGTHSEHKTEKEHSQSFIRSYFFSKAE